MNNILSKFAILLLAVMPLAANVAGQNSVYGIPPLTSTNSLIRNYGDKADIIYNDNGVRSFSHVNFATLIGAKRCLRGDRYDIHEFRHKKL